MTAKRLHFRCRFRLGGSNTRTQESMRLLIFVQRVDMLVSPSRRDISRGFPHCRDFVAGRWWW